MRPKRAKTLWARAWLVVVAASLLPLSVQAQSFLPPDPESSVYAELALAGESVVDLLEGVNVDGNVHSNGDLLMEDGATVSGNGTAYAFLYVDGAVSGTAQEGAARIALPEPYDEVAGRALADRVFEGRTVFEADQIVEDVVFVSGDAIFRGALSGTGTVVSTGDIVLERSVSAGPADPQDRIALVALGGIVLEKGRSLRGVVVAGGDLRLEEETRFDGSAVSHGRLVVEENVNVQFEVFP